MMDWMRKHLSLVAGLTVGVMILWLVGTAVSVRNTRADVAGTLFGRNVTMQSYIKALDAVTRQALLNHGDKFREQVSPKDLEQLAWQRLTFLEEATRRRIQISDQEVVEYIQSWPLFQRNGQFDQSSYEALIRYSLGTTPRQFEEELRGMLMILKLTQSAIQTTVTEDEIKEAFRKKEETIKITYLSVPQESAAMEIVQAARQNPSALEATEKQLGLTPKTTDFFSRTAALPGLEQEGEIFDPLFSCAIGETAGPFKSANGWLIARMESKKPADFAKFDSEKETIRKELADTKQLNAYIAWYSELLKRANLQKSLPEQDSPAQQRQTPAPKTVPPSAP